MRKCEHCRGADSANMTRWERFREKLFFRFNEILFHEDFEDLKNGKYTQGFSDGSVDGAKWERVKLEREQKRYE